MGKCKKTAHMLRCCYWLATNVAIPTKAVASSPAKASGDERRWLLVTLHGEYKK